MHAELDATTPQIRPHPRRDGIRVLDPIQDTEFTLLTPDPVEVDPCETDQFYFPVDTAATVTTDTVETPYFVSAWIRDQSGALVAEVAEGTTTSVPPGRYNVELSTTQVKVYLTVDGAITAESLDNRVRFRVDGGNGVGVGARSQHEQPAATVTTTDDPADVMAAVSTLGSALKTTTCERSFPTLRGHPPLIERGGSLSVPESVTPPETGLGIEVPPSLEYVYPVTSLAYYLGATVTPGAEPRLVADDWTYSLDREDGFESTVARVLKHVFLLDCVTRTEGYYEVDLYERNAVADRVDVDFGALYDRPIAERVGRYLDVPPAAVSEAVPKWKLTADVEARPDYVSTLPFLANELALVRCPTSADGAAPDTTDVSDQVKSIFRGPSPTGELIRGTRTTGETASASTVDQTIFRPAETDSLEQAYIGEGIPIGASKMTVDAYYRRLEHDVSEKPQIRLVVVCNDEQMADENVVSEIYGARDWIEFDISFEKQLSTAEMRDLLATDIDFLHYIGHVDDEGIRCPDGHLDTRDLSEVDVNAFLLNACDSYEQGYGLVEGGAMAGIGTITDIVNEAATSVGRTVAKLLNQGFSLASVISILREHEQIGHHYIVVGDGSASIVKNKSTTPNKLEITETPGGNYDLTIQGYPNLFVPMGSMFTPNIEAVDTFFVNSSEMNCDEITGESLESFFDKQEVPVEYRQRLHWSGSLTLSDLTDRS